MKNSKAMALGLCVALLVAMTGGMAIAAAEDEVFTGFKAGDSEPSATYNIEIPPAWESKTFSTLTDDYFGGQWDLYVVTVGPGCIAVSFAMMDCCIAGDTVAFGAGGRYAKATSPRPACAGAKLAPGLYNIKAAYINPNTGIFPAAYSMQIGGYWPAPVDGEKGRSNVG